MVKYRLLLGGGIMINVNVSINAILMYCDESIANISLGNGYTIEKVYLNDYEYKDKICDASGNLSIDYMGSRLFDEINQIYFMCIRKQEIFTVASPIIEAGKTYTNNDLDIEEEIAHYQEKECSFLNNIFNMLRLYRNGNIGAKSIFFNYKYQVMGFMNYNKNCTSNNTSRNIVDNRFFSIVPNENMDCRQFINRVNSTEFFLMKNIIDEFAWGLEQIDLPTGFEQYTTALEMMLLEHNQRNKKECLSKRIAVLIGGTDVEKTILYDKVKDFYRYRSESLHEGDGRNITTRELFELEDITRKSIVAILNLCNTILITFPHYNWEEIKSSIINDLKTQVTTLITNGILPS